MTLLKGTHTYVILEVGERTYNDIRRKLVEAGYEHVLDRTAEDREVIDMHGIALREDLAED